MPISRATADHAYKRDNDETAGTACRRWDVSTVSEWSDDAGGNKPRFAAAEYGSLGKRTHVIATDNYA